MIIRLQRDSHNLTCHKKSRLLFALNLVRQAVTVHSSVCIIYDTTLRLYAEFVDCKYCTVTCRQFLNLTFAPRKTCNGFFHHSNLALLCYHVTQRFLLYTISGINQLFFSKSFKGISRKFLCRLTKSSSNGVLTSLRFLSSAAPF